jgi:hypothetical protein
MRVERGRLVPATSFDAERLDSYRVGSTVNVRFSADRMRPLERKYRAILGKVIKECDTPWTNAEAAHQALKLSCGYVNVGKTAKGEFMQWPRSIAEFDDQEMTDYYEDVLSILSRITSVDVETLRSETVNVGDDDETPHDPDTGEIIEGEILPPETTESGASPAPENADADAPSSAAAEEADTAQPSASSTDPDASSSSSEALDQAGDPSSSSQGSPAAPETERETLIRFARDVLPLAADMTVSPGAAKLVEKEWAEQIKALSPDGVEKARAISASMRAISNNASKLGPALEHFAHVLGTTVEELEG